MSLLNFRNKLFKNIVVLDLQGTRWFDLINVEIGFIFMVCMVSPHSMVSA